MPGRGLDLPWQGSRQDLSSPAERCPIHCQRVDFQHQIVVCHCHVVRSQFATRDFKRVGSGWSEIFCRPFCKGNLQRIARSQLRPVPANKIPSFGANYPY
jgi:hypothetical protein